MDAGDYGTLKSKTFAFLLIILFATGLLFYPRPVANSNSISLAFLGDIMLGRGVAEAHATNENWPSALAALKPYLSSADLSVANLESPLTAEPLQKNTYDLRASPDALPALTANGISIVSLANNHAQDAGPSGLADTQAALNSAHIRWVGPGIDPLVVSIRDQKVAFLAAQAVDRPLDTATLCRQSGLLRSRVNWVVVLLHWGSEYTAAPDPEQVAAAQSLADCHVDLIVGSHPHVVQKSAWLQSADKTHRTFIAYSLGNALFDQPTPPAAHLGLLLQIELSSGGADRIQADAFEIDWAEGTVHIAGPETQAQLVKHFFLPTAP
jgi:poly-gamma-glutamate capsule biosynthesis protein CapA/YwtB (metallophosphatase superfamily)